jgi:hypothetical protein
VTANIKIELFTNCGRKEYKGRCIGFIDEKKFAAVIETPHNRRRLLSCPTKSLKELSSVENVTNLRLAVALSEPDWQKLFITGPLDMIQQISHKNDAAGTLSALSFISKDEDYILIIEE